MIVWIIGAGGLLGSALTRGARSHGHTVLTSIGVPWHNSEGTVDAIARDAQRMLRTIESAPHPTPHSAPRWALVWAAGRATTASDDAEIELEFRTFERSLTTIKETLRGTPGGVFALASSAGGVYSGSSSPPFDSSTPPRPLGRYGRLKLMQEQAATEILSPSTGLLIARIANLYGPGQDVTKLQGLISRLALTSITKEPLTMFVPLDTLRDYITSDDAAARLLYWISLHQGSSQVRVIASGRATSLAYLINVMKDIARVSTPIASGIHASSAYQSLDLRLTPDTDAVIQEMPLTPLPAGIKDVYEDILSRHQRSGIR